MHEPGMISSTLNAIVGQFDAVERAYETIYVHKSAPVWIVHYPAIEGSRDFYREFWQPYRAIEKVKRGAKVWSANNKRIGEEAQFRTLQEAMEAAHRWFTESQKPSSEVKAAADFQTA